MIDYRAFVRRGLRSVGLSKIHHPWWTVCLHPNTMNDAAFDELEQQLRGRYRGAIVGIGDVQLTRRARSLGDRIESVNFWRRHYFQRGVGLIKKIVRR